MRPDDTQDYCYADHCMCTMGIAGHKMWPFGVSGDSNVFKEMQPRIGRMIGGKFYLRIDDPIALTKGPVDLTR